MPVFLQIKHVKCLKVLSAVSRCIHLPVLDLYFRANVTNAVEGDVITAHAATDYLENMLKSTEKSYTFIALDAVDGGGHKYGWCSEEYYDRVATADSQVLDRGVR